ncbi:hypothetical protein J31TS4_07690 [Paenibacillus sp. J31TS4]|uniref:capping complex subunit for YIEGIA n=1 Tax=Paenibacillus sp. J31TS4 TaxID=2807195 RepID=UPI001B1EFA23|nr:hypothetical protein [Paenibacillus sp. J31TS4]GIP37489.1 hypothetical protein J31TS4_07690 [Paenibacillus sp. J31TS4]
MGDLRVMAVVTTSGKHVGGGVPVFVADGEEEKETLSFRLEKILDAMAHDLGNGTMILVKH